MSALDSLTPGKCPGCGAINNIDPKESTYICECCGKLRAVNLFKEAYQEQEDRKAARRNELIPPGGVVDTVSRKHIFETDIRPDVESALRDYTFGLTSACTNQLLIAPYTLKTQAKVKHNSNQLHSFESELELYEELAVADSAKDLIKKSKGTSTAYAYVLTCLDLLSDRESVNNRYSFLPTNYSKAAEALGDDKKPLKARLNALHEASIGLEDMISGNFKPAAEKLKSASKRLEDARAMAKNDIDSSAMVTAINQEIGTCSSCITVCDSLGDSLDDEEEALALQLFGKLMRELDRESITNTDRKEILEEFSKLVKTRLNGERLVKVASGKGDYMVPMWAVDVKYTFQGGSLFKKKAVEVTETVLVSACFMTSSMEYPLSFVTDIFGAAPKATLSTKFKGVDSLSAGSRISEICSSVTAGGLTGVLVVPLCTKHVAEELCNEYLKGCKSNADKLRMAKCEAREVIYIPCNKQGYDFVPTIDMGGVPPRSLGNPDLVPSMNL